MDKKSDEAFSPSHSSSSRRVMWKLNDEEESFDSIVNYRKYPMRNPNVTEHQSPPPPSNASNDPPNTNSKNLKVETKKPNNSFAIDAWHQVFKLIRSHKLVEELGTTRNLALRYKPSDESVKFRRSKDLSMEKPQQPPVNASQGAKKKKKLVITDVRIESCYLPPQQTAVVREVAPKFAQRIPNDTDSCCSGESEMPKNNPVLNISNTSSVQSLANMTKVSLKSPAFKSSSIAPSGSSVNQNNTLTKTTPSNSPTTSKKRQGTKTTSPNKTNGNASNKQTATLVLPNFRQRQLELHRYRVQVEQKRLDLLELKIAREREEAVRCEILFHKDLQLRENHIKSFDDVSNS